MVKVLILGASGLVGKALIKEFDDRYDVYGTYYRNSDEVSADKLYLASRKCK